MKNTNRIWEIDFLRGIAFLCMVYDHVIFDLNYIFNIRTNLFWGYDYLIGDFSAVLFMILCGISTNLSHSSIKRGLTVCGSALLISLVTYLIDVFTSAGLFIKFGILHLLGIAMILSHFVKKLPNIVIIAISAVVYFIGKYFAQIKTLGNALFFLGIHDNTFASADYYPLFPFLAFVFIGIVIGKLVYKQKQSIFPFTIPSNPISFIGKHSLILYLTHQPVVFALLFVLVKLFA